MSYFDLKISCIPIGAPGAPLKKTDSTQAAFLPVAINQLSFEQWEELYAKHVGDGCEQHLCFLEITDNGVHGDGLRLTVFAGDNKTEIADIYVPDESLDTIISALQAVSQLRKTDGIA